MDQSLIPDYMHLTMRQVRAARQELAEKKNAAEHPLQEQFDGVETWDKDAIRHVLRLRRREVTSEARIQAGRDIAQRFYDDARQFIKRVVRLSLYLSTANEIPTRYLARGAWNLGRQVCVPGWSQRQNTYRLYELNAQSRLIKGLHGIREPAERRAVDTREVDLFILPGLAFDCTGGRIGYGGGNYDRLLMGARKNAVKMAIAYDWQVVTKPLPSEAHDVRIDWIVTPTRVICCQAQGGDDV